MDTESDYDPLEQAHKPTTPPPSSNELSDEIRKLRVRADAFRDLADRFYMLWWNLPGMTTRAVDRDVQDMFRMYMDLAPSLGVSRNGIPELRECCGRKRVWKDDPIVEHDSKVLVMPAVEDPKEDLGWCPGDIIRRITRFFGAPYCEKCDRRRRSINSFFHCGRK